MEKAGAILLIINLSLVYYIILPFIIGIILKGMLKRRNIPEYVPFLLAIVIGLGLLLVNGKSPILIFDNNYIGLIIFILIYALFIKTGIKAYSEFIKGLRT
jgi:hypothetical protein